MRKNKRLNFKNIAILANPASGQVNITDKINKIIVLLENKKINVELIHTFSKIDLLIKGKKLAENGEVDLIIAVGGDGTLRDLLTSVIGTSIPVSIIPSGTGNVFANEMKIPLSPKKWVKMILTGKVYNIDGGMINGRYFLMMAGVGFDALIVKNTENLGIKRIFGRLTYIAGFIRAISDYDYPPVQIEIDDYIHDSGYGVIISNTSHYGVYFSLTPGAICDDGYLDCVIYRQHGIRGFLELFFTAYFSFLGIGKKTRNTGNIRRYRFKKLKITSDSKLPFHIDGDFIGSHSADVSVVNKPFNILLPVNALKSIYR